METVKFAGRLVACQPAATRPRSVPAALIFVVFLCLGTSVHATETWPTTRFKVHVGSPYVGDMTDIGSNIHLYEQENIFGIEEHSIHLFEAALEEAAEWYKQKGFPPPALEPLISTEDGLAYQVYVCERNFVESNWDDFLDFAGMYNSITKSDYSTCGYNAATETTDVGGYFPLCGSDPTRTKFFQINHELSLDANGNLNEAGYQTIAHEMFHAIHSNTPMGQADTDCTISKWIKEGLADAISYDIVKELWSNMYSEESGDGHVIKRFGYRAYSTPLHRSDEVDSFGQIGLPMNFGYQASSFWRYVADSYPRKWKVLVTEKGNNKAPGLLDIPIKGDPGWLGEVDWLDKGLRGKFNHGLQYMYPMFVANLTHRVAPFRRYSGKPAEDNVDHWTERLFGPCEVVNLTGKKIQTVSVMLETLSTKCVRVEPVGTTGLVQISFIAGSNDQKLLKDISFGKGGTTLVTRASPVTQTTYGPTQNTATWPTFPQDGSKSAVYLVSNVARKPSTTTPRTLKFDVVMPGNSNSARATVPWQPKSAPAPQKPSYKKHAESLNQQKSATTKMVHEQMNLDKRSLNPNVNASNRINRVPNAHECTEPFKYTPCGPMMTISLGIHPGTYIVPGMTNTAGGMAGQVMSGLQAMAQTSAFDANERVQELTAVMEGIDGGDVNIAMPLVDYGYSGSFDRAAITVKMSGDRICSAIGPPDHNQRTPLTGKVTIEEYSPSVLIGSFVAPLVESVEGPDGQGTYQSCGTVSGQFTSVAPFLEDERTAIINDSQEQMAEDIVNSLGVPANMAYKMKTDDGTLVPQGAGGSGSSPGSSSGGGMLGGDCSCECENRDSVDELCEFFCEEEFAACDDP